MKRKIYTGVILAGILMAALPVLAQDGARAMPQEQVIGTLNELIETAKDGQLGYQRAADAVKDPGLQRRFQDYSKQRAGFAEQLQARVRELGGEPARDGTLGAAVHRGWINVKSAITGNSREAVLAEVETGESVAVEVYEDALKKELPSNVRSLVREQAQEVQAAYREIKQMENRAEADSGSSGETAADQAGEITEEAKRKAY